MDQLIRRNRRALGRELSGTRFRRWMSPLLLGLESGVEKSIQEKVSGWVLDAGCGQAPYRERLEAVADLYESLDVERHFDDQTYVADVQDMGVVSSERFDAALSSEVLEHVPRPAQALAELHRVLKPGGLLILTTPFLARLHDEPHDYYRYTRHGLHHLLQATGFEVESMDRTGSLFSFVGHQVATVALGTTWHIPLLKWLVLAANAGFVTLPCHWVDRVAGSDLLPLGYVVVAIRK